MGLSDGGGVRHHILLRNDGADEILDSLGEGGLLGVVGGVFGGRNWHLVFMLLRRCFEVVVRHRALVE